MATLDIRLDGAETVDTILFASSDEAGVNILMQEDWGNDKQIRIIDTYSDNSVYVPQCAVQNLIKALQKAVLLGWATE